MHAIILAASRGYPLAEDRPACLAEFGGRSLLARHLDLLYRFGVHTADLVVGFGARRIIDHVGTLSSRPDVAYHFNPRYELGSLLSLLAAEETLRSGSDVLVMDGDVLCHADILQRLLASPVENCFALDRETGHRAEPSLLALHDGRIVDFGKKFADGLDYDTVAESVGFFRFGAKAAACIADECARFEAEGLTDAPYEAVLRNVLLSCPLAFGFEDISGMPWVRIDSGENASRAADGVLPATGP